MDQFAGVKAPVMLSDDVENDTDAQEIDAITAATITSSAVVRGVNQAVDAIAPYAGFETQQGGAQAVGEGRYAATKAGFNGDVYVEIALDDEKKISDIVIGDENFNESAGLGARAQEDEFKNQFIGKSGKLELGTDIDAIAGATITSQAVVDAVNEALASKN